MYKPVHDSQNANSRTFKDSGVFETTCILPANAMSPDTAFA